ncbi:carboxypeptidase-like regulatory domain-containing protein [Puia sp. P3]|uniref:carboxypeptidase-like regulatory domain-containing protein n=1 Tax=Puia sp. P3 TaxID=3423952 RepID=UPI003D674C01
MKLLLSIVLLFGALGLQAQVKHTISGSVKAKNTGESIIRATVIVSGQRTGVTTNDYGYYSLTLPEGKYTLQISSAGRQMQTVEVDLKENIQLVTLLEEQGSCRMWLLLRRAGAGVSGERRWGWSISALTRSKACLCCLEKRMC